MTDKRQGGTLSQWFVFTYPAGEKVVIGNISGDRYWANGETLRTSQIVKLEDTHVETRNTIYQLGDYFSGDKLQYATMLAIHWLCADNYEEVIERGNLS